MFSKASFMAGGKATYENQQKMKLTFKKVEDGVYIIIPQNLDEGEYVFTYSFPGQSEVVPPEKGFGFAYKK
jgi:hypothetical protein